MAVGMIGAVSVAASRRGVHVGGRTSSVPSEVLKASLERALLEKKLWEEFLEKLRKSGGGGGGLRRIDRIAVSFMLSHFLSAKVIKALMQNINMEFLKQFFISQNLLVKVFSILQSGTAQILSLFGKPFTTNVFGNLQTHGAKVLQSTFQKLEKATLSLATAISFLLNKLKEILENEYQEEIQKKDIKDKLNNFKKRLIPTIIAMINNL